MKILIDIGHPAHVHFFFQPIRLLSSRGHDLLVTSRDKDVTLPLLQELAVPSETLSVAAGGILGFARELVQRDYALWKVAKRFGPARMAEIGGTFIAHVGLLGGIPSLAFYDTENATLQNAITYPFASCVLVPRCYQGWLPRGRHVRYNGYHELSYLHPHHFVPQQDVALRNGLDPERDTFLIRLVSWKANHDIGEKGWSRDLLAQVTDYLTKRGKVLISSESQLEPPFDRMQYRGQVAEMHHLLAFCRAFVGESATMASEAAVLGVPAIYAAHTGRGYTDEQEKRYGLVCNVRSVEWPPVQEALNEMLAIPSAHWKEARSCLLADTLDVAGFVADAIEHFPDVLLEYRQRITS